MLTTEVPTTATACHEGHPDSIVGFALSTLAGTAGFGHRYVSMTGRLSSQNILRMMWRLLQDAAHVRHTVRAPLLTHRCSALQFKTNMGCSLSFQSRRPHCEPPRIAIQVSQDFARLRLCRWRVRVLLKVLSLVPSGEPAGTRTQGPRLKRAMLYRLSYRLTIER